MNPTNRHSPPDDDLRAFIQNCQQRALWHLTCFGIEANSTTNLSWSASIRFSLMRTDVIPLHKSCPTAPHWTSHTTIGSAEIPMLRIYTLAQFEAEFIEASKKMLDVATQQDPSLAMKLQAMICRVEKSLEPEEAHEPAANEDSLADRRRRLEAVGAAV